MGAVDLLGVEPYIALEGLLAGEQVVLVLFLPTEMRSPAEERNSIGLETTRLDRKSVV